MSDRPGYERIHKKDKHVCVAQGPTALDFSHWLGMALSSLVCAVSFCH